MIGDILADKFQPIGVELGKEPAGLETVFSPKPERNSAQTNGKGEHIPGSRNFIRAYRSLGKQAADPIGVKPLQAEALRTSFGGEKLYPVLWVGIGDR